MSAGGDTQDTALAGSRDLYHGNATSIFFVVARCHCWSRTIGGRTDPFDNEILLELGTRLMMTSFCDISS